MADWDDLAQAFQNGDVLYGLDQPRAAARQAILGAGGVSASTPVTKMFLCCIPYTSGSTTDVLIQNDLTNAVWDTMNAGQYSSDNSISKTLTDANRGKLFRNFISNHVDYDVASQVNAGTVDITTTAGQRTAWTRTSKAGIEFQIRSAQTVHFILTDLQVGAIANKTGYGGKGNITSAELRWLYRHRQTTEVQQHVRFWEADGEVAHDTLWNNAAWANYHPNNEITDMGRENTMRTALAVATTQ